MIGIYKIENLVNGKVYIGQSNDIEKRWYDHKRDSFILGHKHYEYPLYRAFRKYGIENFSFEVILECEEWELDEWEIYFIEIYKSYCGNKNGWGYNQSLGGESGSRGYKWTKEQKEKQSKRVKGEKNGFYGKSHSKEAKEKMSKKRKGKTLSQEHKAKISDGINKIKDNIVYCSIVCDNQKFNSLIHICEKFGVPYHTMKTWLSKKEIPVEWYVLGLRYENEDMSIYSIKPDKRRYYGERLVFYCDGERLTNLAEFAKKEGHPSTTIRDWLYGNICMPKEYYDRGLHLDNIEQSSYICQGEKPRRNNKYIYCGEKIFRNIDSCRKFYGKGKSAMRAWLNGQNPTPQEFRNLGLRYTTKEETNRIHNMNLQVDENDIFVISKTELKLILD